MLVTGAAALLALAVYGTLHGVWHRFTYGDDSRSDLWRAGLAMLWDAPGGVGTGNASTFYAQWYQEIGDRRGYLSLINYHLDWLAGHGVAARGAYVLSWAGLAWVVWPFAKGISRAGACLQTISVPANSADAPRASSPASRLLLTAAAVWLTFFVAAIFSTTASVWQVWALPLVWLVAAFVWRIRQRDWASPKVALRICGAALVTLGALHIIGWRLSDSCLAEAGSQMVKWGDANPSFVIYDPNPDVLGNKWGHDIREQSESVYVLYPGAAVSLPADSHATWILSGSVPEKLPPQSRVFVLNIPASPELLEWLRVHAPNEITVVLSDSLCDALKCATWSEWAAKDNRVILRVMGGTGLYVPNWMP